MIPISGRMRSPLQVISDLLALDGRHDTEVLSINGASAALSLSDIPWAGPVGAVRVGCCNHSYCINPSLKQVCPIYT